MKISILFTWQNFQIVPKVIREMNYLLTKQNIHNAHCHSFVLFRNFSSLLPPNFGCITCWVTEHNASPRLIIRARKCKYYHYFALVSRQSVAFVPPLNLHCLQNSANIGEQKCLNGNKVKRKTNISWISHNKSRQ